MTTQAPGVAGMDAAQIAIDEAAKTPTTPSEGRGRPPVEAKPPELEQVKDPGAPTPEADVDAKATIEAPPAPAPKADPLARAKAAIEDAKRKKARRQREAEEAMRARSTADQAMRQAAWERQQREEAEARARAYEEMTEEEFLKRRGRTAKDIVERALEADTPEAKQRAQQEAFERQLAEERAARERLEMSLQQRQQADANERRTREFMDLAGREDDYPEVAQWAKDWPDSLLREAAAVEREAAQRTGRYPSCAEICEYLEWKFTRRTQKRERTAGERNGPTTQGERPTPAQAGQPAARATALTSRVAERAQLPKRVDEMTRDEQMEHFAAELRKSAG